MEAHGSGTTFFNSKTSIITRKTEQIWERYNRFKNEEERSDGRERERGRRRERNEKEEKISMKNIENWNFKKKMLRKCEKAIERKQE